MEQEKCYSCCDCYHSIVCRQDALPKNCDHFVLRNCVVIQMSDDDREKANKRLNDLLEDLLSLKKRLDGGDRTMGLYWDIMDIGF